MVPPDLYSMCGSASFVIDGGTRTGRGQCQTSMMTSSNGNISALLALCGGNSPVTGNSPHKGQWRGAFMFSLICAWINGWVKNHEAGDLRRHRAHYVATIMILAIIASHERVALQLLRDVTYCSYNVSMKATISRRTEIDAQLTFIS